MSVFNGSIWKGSIWNGGIFNGGIWQSNKLTPIEPSVPVTWEADYVNTGGNSPNAPPKRNNATSPMPTYGEESPNGLNESWTIPASATGQCQHNFTIIADNSSYLHQMYVKPLGAGTVFKIGVCGINGVSMASIVFDFDTKSFVSGGANTWAVIELTEGAFAGWWIFARKVTNNGTGSLYIDRVDAGAGQCIFWQRRIRKLDDADHYQVSQLYREWDESALTETVLERQNKVITPWGDSFVRNNIINNGTETFSSVVSRSFGFVRSFDDSNGNAPTGVGGDDSSEVLIRFLAMSQALRNARMHLIWSGHNNHHQPAQVQADIAAMVAAFDHNEFLVIGLTHTALMTTAQKLNVAQLNADLLATYGSRFVEVMPTLLASGDNSAADNNNIANNTVPASLRSDDVHLNAQGQKLVGDLVVAKIHGLNIWDNVYEYE